MKRPLAPSLPEAPSGAPDPVRELRDRERNAIAKRIVDPRRAAVEASGVDGAATPPKATAGAATSTPKKEPAATPTKAGADSAKDSPASDSVTSSTPTPDEEKSAPSEDTAQAAPEAKGPRYDVKSFKKWAEKDPEAAAEFAQSIGLDVFRGGEDPKQEWIRLQNKKRKLRDGLEEEKTKAATELKQERDNIDREVARVEKIANEIRYVSEMWGGAQRKNAAGQPDPDFDTIDEAFRVNTGGMTIDDYNRQRARRGISNPETARLKAENARMARLLAQQTNGAAASAPSAAQGAPEAVKPAAAPAALPAPAAPTVDWSGEVPKTHALRQFADWQVELDAEMAKYHDEALDEYSRDPEEVADALFKRKMKALAGDEEEETPAPRTRPKTPNTPKRRGEAAPTSVPGIPAASKLTPRGEVNHDRSHRETTLQAIVTNDGGMAERTRYAMERAQRRLRGEQVD